MPTPTKKKSIETLGARAPRPLRTVGAAAAFFALASCISPAIADTYQFELRSELAVSPAKKVDLSQLKDLAKPGMTAKPELFSKDAEPVWKTPETSTLTVSTGPDALLVKGKEFTRIYDFKNKKIHELDAPTKTFWTHSLFGDLAFRSAELHNRIFLSEMMGSVFKGKAQGKFFDKFYSEELFCMRLPEKSSGYKLSKTKKGNEDVYTYAAQVVSSFVPSATALFGDKRRQFSRYLIYATHMHPDIRIDIEKNGKLPQKFMYYVENPPVNKERKTLVLKGMSPGDYSAVLPEGYKAKLDPNNPLNPVHSRIEALGGKPPADLKELTLDYFNKAVEKNNYFDAMLAVTEYGLQTGENLGEKMAQIKDNLKGDPDCQKFIGGLATPQNEQEAILALGSLDMIDRSKSGKSYLIDIFRANLLVKMSEEGMRDVKSSQEKDPAKAFISVLEHNPFIAGVYHDLGNLLERAYLQVYAWECYDLARKFYPAHPFMEEINEKEKSLSTQFPQFFSGDKL